MKISLSEKIEYLLYEAVESDMSDLSAVDTRVVKEDLLQFLTELGIEEGVDYCVDDDEIYLPAGISVGSISTTPFGEKVFDRWPSFTFSYPDAKSEFITARSKNIEVDIPISVFPLIELHSTKKK
jgi:hypothetical protein